MYSLLHSFHRAGQISEKITKLRDISVVAPTAQHFLDETYSDSQYTLAALHAYQQKTSASAHLVNLLKYKESKISSKRIAAHYSLSASDEAFKSFAKTFNDVMRAAVLDNYGKFSEFTTPILSLDQITLLANKFRNKTDLCIMPMGAGQCFESNLIPIRFSNDNTMDSVHVVVINSIGIGKCIWSKSFTFN